jgi:hypothetical protein
MAELLQKLVLYLKKCKNNFLTFSVSSIIILKVSFENTLIRAFSSVGRAVDS